MGIMSSIYNSDFNIEQLFLGSEEITEMYLGDQLVFSKITNNLFYKLHEFVGSLTVQNTVEAPVKSAILKGNTKYRDIDTGDILDTFNETKNLELVSVKMPVLTTSNEDGTKTNILTVNEDVTLRGIGDVKDELNLLTGEYVQRIGEIVLDGSLRTAGMYNLMGKTKGFYFPLNTIQLKPIHNEDVPKIVICDKFRVTNNECQWAGDRWLDEEFVSATLDGRIAIRVLTTKASTRDELHQYLSQNPITVYYQLATELVKTVDLSSNKVYAYNGTTHYTCSSEEGSLIPTACIEVPVETEAVE